MPDNVPQSSGRSGLISPMGAARPLLTALRHGLSAVIELHGDSTGDEATEWFGLLGQRIGTAFSSYHVLFRPWNDTNSEYDMPTVLRAGPSGETYVTATGSAGMQYAAAAITGDIDIRVKARLTTWASGTQVLCARYNASGNQVSWYLTMNSSGRPVFSWSTDGTTTVTSKAATATPAFTNGAWGWLRCTVDVDNGASGNDIRFYTSSDGATWTQLGSTVTTAGATSLFGSTGPYTILSRDTSHASPMAGDLAWVEIRDGIGGPSLVPPLAASWDQHSSITTDTCVINGSPTLLLLDGSQGGMDVPYFDDSTRRPKLLMDHAPNLILTSVGHNSDNITSQAFITEYAAWVNNIKTALPGVPIVCITQSPAVSPRLTNNIQVRSRRGLSLVTWAFSQSGVSAIDTYPAFTNTAVQVQSDGVHPTSAGSQVWGDFMYRSLFGTL